MRKIKFRAKDEVNGVWVYGNYLYDDEKDKHIIRPIISASIYCNPDTLGQYIGAKDVNKIEIYEGDIVKSNGKLHVVSYDEYCAQFLFCNDEEDMGYGNLFIVEVVGNIYDNPELLEEML